MTNPPGRRVVPLALGLTMLAILVAAGIAPNVGAVQAASGCSYGNTCSSSSPIPTWAYGAIAAVVLAAIIGILLLMRRRRSPPSAAAPAQEWQGGTSGGPGGPGAEGPTPPAGAAAYVESPEDVGQAPPYEEAPVVPAGAGGAAGAAGAAGGEPDIDSLMAELDKISGEILKRNPKKGTDTSSTPEDTGDEGGSN
jgi:hypothetical protein